MVLYMLSAVAVVAIGGAFTFWLLKQMDDDPTSSTSKKSHTRRTPVHLH